MLKSAQSAWDNRQTVDGLPLFGAFWDRTAETADGGREGGPVRRGRGQRVRDSRTRPVGAAVGLDADGGGARVTANARERERHCGGGSTGMTEPRGLDAGRRHCRARQSHPLHGVAGRNRSRRVRRLPRSCGRRRWTTSPGSGMRSGTSSTSARRRLPKPCSASREMPGAQVVSGCDAELRRSRSSGTRPTSGPRSSWPARTVRRTGRGQRLREETAAFANYLRRLGVKPGDRVVGYLPNIGEAVVAFLGAASRRCDVGGVQPGSRHRRRRRAARAARTDACWWPATVRCTAGSAIDRSNELAEIRAQLPTLKATVLVPRLGAERRRPTSRHGLRCSNSTRRWRSRRCRSPIRCGCCSPPAPPARRRASCTAMAAWCSNTSST